MTPALGGPLAALRRASRSRLEPALKRTLVAVAERLVGRHALHGPVPGYERALYRLAVPGLAGPYLVVRGRVLVSGWALDLALGRPVSWRVRVGRRLVPASPVERADVATAFRRISRLPLACGGRAEIAVGPGPHRLAVEVEGPDGSWHPIFGSIVLSLPRGRERRDADPARDAGQGITADRRGVSVTAIVLDATGDALAETLASLEAQSVTALETVLVGAGRAGPDRKAAPDLASALASARGDHVLVLRAGDWLAPSALEDLVAAAEAEGGLALVYADEESPQADTDPQAGDTPQAGEAPRSGAAPLRFCKPGWSPDTLEAFDCIGAPALYRTDAVRGLGAENPFDLALRFSEMPRTVRRLPKVLCRRSLSGLALRDEASDRRALLGHLARTGRTGTVEPIEPGFAVYRTRVDPPSPAPLVSIVIPTAGRDLEIDGRRLDLAVDCVRGIRERSSYAAIEIVTVVNPDLPPEKAAALDALGCRQVLFSDPVFNVARKLNLGVAAARGPYVLLLNDDVEIVAPDWIERLLVQAAKPHVGVVGGKLLYPNGTIQHAGVVLHGGNPDHVRRHYPKEDLGYFFSTAAVRNYVAVTGACMMVRQDVYHAVGGYTEALVGNFNDVDFCLKVRALGLHVVYEPGCELIHYESVSRVARVDLREYDDFRTRWAGYGGGDPLYDGEVLAVKPPTFELAPG